MSENRAHIQPAVKAASETIASLAQSYGVAWVTMRRWLDKIGMVKPQNGGNIYTPEEVRTIYEKLGEP